MDANARESGGSGSGFQRSPGDSLNRERWKEAECSVRAFESRSFTFIHGFFLKVTV